MAWSWLKRLVSSPEDNGPVEQVEPEEIDKGDPVSRSAHDVRQRIAAARREYIKKYAIQRGPQLVTADGVAMDEMPISANAFSLQGTILPDTVFAWYVSQSFIGWQACAILSQHWLVSKACMMAGKDAAQGGWKVCRDDGEEMTPEQIKAIEKLDKKYKVFDNLVNASYFRNVFGIRIVMFLFDGMDYSRPFEPAMVRAGTYRGMTQLDPYWCAPFLTANSVSDPTRQDFYVPEYWQINAKKVHKSHLVILYGQPVPDILKPTYFYGGVPLTQRIYERVYAAERTSNEAPQLAATKRLTVRYSDLAQAMMDEEAFKESIAFGSQFQDNYGVLIADTSEKVERHDTSLADLDEVIMTQYQLVAAEAETPATKLLGTSPKGFGASGDYETKSYHEKCRDIQKTDYNQILERHYQCLALSDLASVPRPDIVLTVQWLPLDKPSAKEMAELNKLKADTDAVWQGTQALDSRDIRKRIIEDEDSGYTGIEFDELIPGLGAEIEEGLENGEENSANEETPGMGGQQGKKQQSNAEGNGSESPNVG